MRFILSGLEIYTAEVDDRGIDLVVRKNDKTYYDIQVKSAYKTNYIFMRKDKFDLRENLYVAVVLFYEGKSPNLY